jgi:hypothetical protein
MLWLIAAQRMGIGAPPAENQGPWFTHKYDQEWGLNGELPLVQMLKDLPSKVRQDGPIPVQWGKPDRPDEPGRAWDARLTYLGVTLQLASAAPGGGGGASAGTLPGGPYWKLVQAEWLNQEEASGASQIFVKALDAQGKPIEDATFAVARPDAQDLARTKGAWDDFWGNYTMYGLLGTYTVAMQEGGYPSEQVSGVGLGTEEVPGAWANTAFRFTFQLIEGDAWPRLEELPDTTREPHRPVEETQPPEPSGPASPPDPAEFERALRATAEEHIRPIDRNAPFYTYAREHALGERLSDEFTLEHQGSSVAAQAFERGIVYTPSGQPDRIAHIDYEG